MTEANLEAGPELDALIGKRFGLPPLKVEYALADPSSGDTTCWGTDRRTVGAILEEGQRRRLPYADWEIRERVTWPAYSTEIAAAWQLVEKLRETPVLLGLFVVHLHTRILAHRAWPDQADASSLWAFAEPEDICRAFIEVSTLP